MRRMKKAKMIESGMDHRMRIGSDKVCCIARFDSALDWRSCSVATTLLRCGSIAARGALLGGVLCIWSLGLLWERDHGLACVIGLVELGMCNHVDMKAF